MNPRALALLISLGTSAPAVAEECHSVHGTMVEDKVIVGCNEGEAFCYLGKFEGNQGLRSLTHFKADSAAAGPATGSPGFVSYSGPFEYRFDDGVIQSRETGVTNPRKAAAGGGATAAYQQITGGTGAYSKVTGYVFVTGVNLDGHVETAIDGELCNLH